MAKIIYTKTPEGRQVRVSYKNYYDAVHTLNKEIGKIRSKIAKKYELIAKEERAIADAYFEIGRRYKSIDMLKKLKEDTSAIPTLEELIKQVTEARDVEDKKKLEEGK